MGKHDLLAPAARTYPPPAGWVVAAGRMDGAGTNEKSRRSDESASESASRGMKKDAATRGRVQENKMLAELAKRKRFVRTSEDNTRSCFRGCVRGASADFCFSFSFSSARRLFPR